MPKSKINLIHYQELNKLQSSNKELNELCENNLKPKNKALKSKLREKVDYINVIEKEYESYRLEKEQSMVNIIQNNKKIINEKNSLINEIMKQDKKK